MDADHESKVQDAIAACIAIMNRRLPYHALTASRANAYGFLYHLASYTKAALEPQSGLTGQLRHLVTAHRWEASPRVDGFVGLPANAPRVAGSNPSELDDLRELQGLLALATDNLERLVRELEED